MQTEYTVDYFIAKLTNTRDDMWTTGVLKNDDGKTCALGWCGLYANPEYPTEGIMLIRMMNPLFIDGIFYRDDINYDNAPALINNGGHPNYQQETPKQRILAALQDIKKMQEGQEGKVKDADGDKAPEPIIKEKIRYIAVDEKIKELVGEVITN